MYMDRHANRGSNIRPRTRLSAFAFELPTTCFLSTSFCACSSSSAPIVENATGSSIRSCPRNPVCRSNHKNNYTSERPFSWWRQENGIEGVEEISKISSFSCQKERIRYCDANGKCCARIMDMCRSIQILWLWMNLMRRKLIARKNPDHEYNIPPHLLDANRGLGRIPTSWPQILQNGPNLVWEH